MWHSVVCQPDLAHGPFVVEFFTRCPSNVAQDSSAQSIFFFFLVASLSCCTFPKELQNILQSSGEQIYPFLLCIIFYNDCRRWHMLPGHVLRGLSKIEIHWLSTDTYFVCAMYICGSSVMEKKRCIETSTWCHITDCDWSMWGACYRNSKQLTKVQLLHIWLKDINVDHYIAS